MASTLQRRTYYSGLDVSHLETTEWPSFSQSSTHTLRLRAGYCSFRSLHPTVLLTSPTISSKDCGAAPSISSNDPFFVWPSQSADDDVRCGRSPGEFSLRETPPCLRIPLQRTPFGSWKPVEGAKQRSRSSLASKRKRPADACVRVGESEPDLSPNVFQVRRFVSYRRSGRCGFGVPLPHGNGQGDGAA